jgi:uncharacterized protein
MILMIIIYLLIVGVLSYRQENMIFFPQQLTKEHVFSFDRNFEEVFIPVTNHINLHGLLFKADITKGLIFYLHGNAGSADTWGWIASTYTDLNYDIFILDYRGFGKSEGSISSEKQFFKDVQVTYNALKQRYNEDKIVIVGYSVGTGPAAWLASQNNPKLLILQAPYYSLEDLMLRFYPFVPVFLLRYKFKTYHYLEKIKVPVIIFHGKQDETIYYGSSEKLKLHLKPNDQVNILEGLGHSGIDEDITYKQELARILH